MFESSFLFHYNEEKLHHKTPLSSHEEAIPPERNNQRRNNNNYNRQKRQPDAEHHDGTGAGRRGRCHRHHSKISSDILRQPTVADHHHHQTHHKHHDHNHHQLSSKKILSVHSSASSEAAQIIKSKCVPKRRQRRRKCPNSGTDTCMPVSSNFISPSIFTSKFSCPSYYSSPSSSTSSTSSSMHNRSSSSSICIGNIFKSICIKLLVFHLITTSSFCLSPVEDTTKQYQAPSMMASSDNSPNIAKYQIHKKMTKQDLLSVFYVDSHDKVPEYELSTVRLLTKRSTMSDYDDGGGIEDDTKHIQLKAFGRKLRLKLKDNNDFNERVKDMKVIIAETSRNGKLQYVEDLSVADTQNVGTSYHDRDNMAAILLDHNSKGKVQLHGTIGHDLVIKPIPETMETENHPLFNEIDAADPNDDEMFLNEDEFYEATKSRSKTNQTAFSNKKFSKRNNNNKSRLMANENIHVIFKRQIHQHQPPSDFAPLEHGIVDVTEASHHITSQWLGDLRNVTTAQSKRSPRRKRQAPGTVWPEVLLVVDYDSFMLHGATSRDVKRYFISFWNGVDLRYKLLAHPQIRVSLAGMIVAKDRDATPYLERNRLRPPNADAVDAAGALTDMGKYLYREDRLPTYDMAVVITKLDMCRRRYEGGRCNRGTAGFAYVGGACVVNKRLEKVNSVAIIEDSGGYSGIIVAAHEVGHLLGCVHDGSPPPSYLGGPGATRCPWEDGFIMSDLRHTERGFRWSSCSVEQFKHFLNGETATCLYNFPHENQLLPRVLPGSMLSLDEQCKRDRGTNACFKDGRVCAQLFCFDSASGYCVSYRPAAEGSPCGDGQICRNGKCLAEMENIIPDYSHVQQSISRGPKPDRLLSRIDSGPMHNMMSPFRRSLRFRGRDFFHNNFLRRAAAASDHIPTIQTSDD